MPRTAGSSRRFNLKVLLALTYYQPHISGLTIYVERLAQALVSRGHEVTVLTSQYDKQLPREEVIDGVRIVRVPVAFKLSKGVLMPTFGIHATRLAKENDVMSVHLPQFDAWGLALRGRLFNKPCILTYHCDLELPPGRLNRVIDQVTFVANYVAATLADKIVAYTQDYADHSRLLRRFKRKIEVILPPVVMPQPSSEEVAEFKRVHELEGRRVIGIAARFATEKGVEVVVNAASAIEKRFPEYKVLFAGPWRDIVGEEAYRAALLPKIEAMGDHWKFIGTLKPNEMPAFFGSLDCLVVPSVNMTESFGLVQVEAMLCGTPVVASNLPGVRQPIRMTGMGEVIPIGDSEAFATAVASIFDDRARYVRPRAEIEELFGLEQTVESYEKLFEDWMAKKAKAPEAARRGEQNVTEPLLDSKGSVGMRVEQGPEGYLQRMLADATLPRLLIRAAECMLLSKVKFDRPMLDIGSGDGSFADALFTEPIDVGLDPWRDQMNYSRTLKGYNHLVQAAGNPMPFRDGVFGSILSNSTLEHTQDPADIIKEMYRVTRSGGTCVITVPSQHFPKFLLGSSLLRTLKLEQPAGMYETFMNKVSRHIHVYPLETWKGWFEDAGFDVPEARYYFGKRDTMLLDAGHYVSAPSILTHMLLKRWVLFPAKRNFLPLAKLLAPFSKPGKEESEGAYIFLRSVKP